MLLEDWKDIVKHAWSFRLGVLAAVLSAAEIVLPMFQMDIPRTTFAVLSFVTIVGAIIARLLVQKNMGLKP